MVDLNSHQFAFIFGLLGNIVAFFVFLAPLNDRRDVNTGPSKHATSAIWSNSQCATSADQYKHLCPTFVIICKNKSSAGFQSIPYSVGLSSAMLLLYYGFLKTNATLLISINAFGCAIELTYLFIHMIFGSRRSKMLTLKLLVLFNIGGMCIIVALTTFILKNKKQRVTAVGWICAAFSLVVFAAPLAIMRKVIKTKSVEFMPFTLSLCLTINAVMWFLYGFFVKDKFIAMPNIIGFLFGLAQMILYTVYRNAKNKTIPIGQAANIEDKKLESTENEIMPIEDVRLNNNNSNNV